VNPVAPFDYFAPGAADALVLFLARVSGLVLVAPVFAARTVPVAVRTGIVLLLTVLLVPIARASTPSMAAITPAAVIGETLVGFSIGLGAALLIGAAESAGEVLAIQIGLSGAAIVDPLSAHQATALGQFTQLFALSLLLSLDGHLVMLDSLASSLRHIPLGGAMDIRAGLGGLVSLGSQLFALGVQFAAPVVATILVANVALAVLSRAAPQLNILSLAFPIQIMVGLAAVVASLPFLATWLLDWERMYDGMLTRAFQSLSLAGVR
jgi:flagellar biosynthesis protein FliR